MEKAFKKWYKDAESWSYSVLRANVETFDAIVLGIWEVGDYSGIDLFFAKKVTGKEEWLLSVEEQYATEEKLIPPEKMVPIIKQAMRLRERLYETTREDELDMIDIDKLTDEQKDQMSAEELIALSYAKLRRDYGDEVADQVQKRRREANKRLFKIVGSCIKCGGDVEQFDATLGTEGLCFECFIQKEEKYHEEKRKGGKQE